MLPKEQRLILQEGKATHNGKYQQTVF